ncbi:Signal transduction histidine kinase [Bryocella elongata]|uniref:histidine kinase n=1 Tax=Bryocella elongata TaxID=863522 RepID=A0A1H6AC76_9BACT|nr:HAMP domain-containing sensor histidine kinase [Bryocella elongata]SEG45982.1 Signal transduction histidine kinase [Bryocella elongata]
MAPSSLMPHAVCWRADPQLIWTMVVTNAITFLSYSGICLTLLHMVRRTKRVIARDWAWFVVGFALFIVACGSTHLMEVVTTWVPWFWLDATANIVTAALSAYVAVMLVRRRGEITFSINDYAARLVSSESERVRLEQSLLTARKLDDWSRMSAVLAHEISNPLEAIQNLVYLISHSEDATPEIAELARTAGAEVERVVKISRSSLAFFRHSNTPEATDLMAAAESVRALLIVVFAGRNLRLEVEGHGDLTVEALPGELRQVLLNLIRNACEATPKDGSAVTVTLTGERDGVEIVVADEGSGIEPGILPNLFTFGITTKGEKGNGMGLWTVKHIVTRHGGTIRVESTLGKGTRFILWWPRVFPQQASEAGMPGLAAAAK